MIGICKKYTMQFAFMLVIAFILSSCSPIQQHKTSKAEIKTKEAIWNFESLNVSTFKNGTSIPEAKSDEEWIKLGADKKPAWSYIDNDKNGGKVYNWYAAASPNGLAPEGWHIPNDKEWTLLINNFGGEMDAGKNMRASIDEQLFNLGIRDSNGKFQKNVAAWWTVNSINENYAIRRFGYSQRDFILRNMDSKMQGLSVVCVKD